jgi:hypothetical protein
MRKCPCGEHCIRSETLAGDRKSIFSDSSAKTGPRAGIHKRRVSCRSTESPLGHHALKTMVIYVVTVEIAFTVLVALGCGLALAFAGMCSSPIEDSVGSLVSVEPLPGKRTWAF